MEHGRPVRVSTRPTTSDLKSPTETSMRPWQKPAEAMAKWLVALCKVLQGPFLPTGPAPTGKRSADRHLSGEMKLVQ